MGTDEEEAVGQLMNGSDFQRVTGHCCVMVIATECRSEDRRFESRESPVGLLVKQNYVI